MSSIASQGRDAPHAEPSEVVMPPLPRFFLSSGLKTHPDLEAQTSIATPSEVPGCPVARRHRRAKPSSPTRLLPVRRRRHRPRQLCSCTNGVAWPPATTNSLSPTALPPSSAPASPGHVYWETRPRRSDRVRTRPLAPSHGVRVPGSLTDPQYQAGECSRISRTPRPRRRRRRIRNVTLSA